MGALVIVVWTAFCCSIMFGIMSALKVLRVSKAVEISGLDRIKHGEPAYPVRGYNDGEHPHGIHNAGCKLTVAVKRVCKIIYL